MIANAAGTLTDVSAYVTGTVDVGIGSDDTDVTTFAAGGAAIAEKHIQGALTSSVKIKFMLDLVICNLLRQIVGSRVGFVLQIYSGTNAAPTLGDEVYNGTVTLLAPSISYQPGQVATIDCEFMPVDGTTVVPSISTY